MDDSASRDGAGPFLPLLLVTLALIAWLGFQGAQLWVDRQQLASVEVSLKAQDEAAKKLRSSLDAVAAATAKLAAAGNANARLVVEELRKRGVTINTAAPAN